MLVATRIGAPERNTKKAAYAAVCALQLGPELLITLDEITLTS